MNELCSFRAAAALVELMSGVAVPDAGATGGSFAKREIGRGFGPTHVALRVAS
jgi:hypothetical protein